MGLLFFPRGGSAQVARYLAPALADGGRSVALVSGSLGSPGEQTHAATFFAGADFDRIDVPALDFTAAVAAFVAGGSAIAAPVPMHPSYEDRDGAPDVVLASVEPALADHLAAAWEQPFVAAGTDRAELVHLHHLTPQHDLVARRWPDVPIVAHLHGTELKLIEAIQAREAVAAAIGTTLEAMDDRGAADALVAPGRAHGLDDTQRDLLRTTRWERWRHGRFWVERLRRQAHRADHLVVVSPPDQATAIEVLGVEGQRVSAVPNGVDVERFAPRARSAAGRRAAFRRWLVEDPQGWDASGRVGSVAYRDDDLDRLLGAEAEATVLVFVGRFTAAKRVPTLVRAFAKARSRFAQAGSLLVWGGHPGECEGEHPVMVAAEVGADGIAFAGWRGHEDLPAGLAACDVLVMPSVNDSYPQTPLEAMAVGLPVLATTSGGFPSMINLDPDRPTGWLVPPDDVDALADALVEVVNRPGERAERGRHALDHARADLSWSGLVPRFEAAYDLAIERRKELSRRSRRGARR